MAELTKFAISLALALVTAGCADRAPRQAPPGPSIQITYVDGAGGPAVDVSVVHRLPLTQAELILLDGRTIRAATIDRETTRADPGFRPDIGVGVFGGSRGIEGTGIGIGLPLGGIGQPPPPGPVRARARVAIPDDDAYRRDWRDYIVRLRFGAPPGEISLADIPAPAPRGR